MGDSFDLGAAEPGFAERARQLSDLADVFQPFRRAVYPIVIRADGKHLNPADFGDVAGMLDDVADGDFFGEVQEGRAEIEPDEPAAFRDRTDLVVGEIAIVIGECMLAFPIVVSLTHGAVFALDRRASETARTLGANRFRRWMTYMSEARTGVTLAILAAFSRCVTELGIAMIHNAICGAKMLG